MMDHSTLEIKLKGKRIQVPAAEVCGRTVIVLGKWLRQAMVLDEAWIEGDAVECPEDFVERLSQKGLKADLFTFGQKLPSVEPKHAFHLEWDNAAAIRLPGYTDWWEKRLPQVTRKSVRRGTKRGVIVESKPFDDHLVRGIMGIHDDTPMKQGEPFAHYGKGFEVVKRDYGTFLDRSEFLCAYFDQELIGILKLVFVGSVASIMQIITKTKHYDKRPTNILIAKAVEAAEKRGCQFLIYGKYIYGNKTNSSLTEFKRRNGFEKIVLPRYYVPLTTRGELALRLGLHRGFLDLLPAGLITALLALRGKYYSCRAFFSKAGVKQQSSAGSEAFSD